jgi:hypothetical protein
VCLWPYSLACEEFLVDNALSLQQLRYAIEETSPTDTMMDGRTGIGVFRPHAYFYWFMNSGVLAMMTDEQRSRLLADLQTGKIAPRYLLLDEYLARALRRIPWFVFGNYLRVPSEPIIWERKTPAR